MKINLNQNVRVKLTDHGRGILKEQHQAFYKRFSLPEREYTPPKEDVEGWSTWQLWVLMEELGPHCGMGKQLPFETEIEMPDAPL